MVPPCSELLASLKPPAQVGRFAGARSGRVPILTRIFSQFFCLAAPAPRGGYPWCRGGQGGSAGTRGQGRPRRLEGCSICLRVALLNEEPPGPDLLVGA